MNTVSLDQQIVPLFHQIKAYPAYKDSGLPWLGKIPIHWEVERAKWLFRKMERPVRPTDEVVTCFRDGTVTLRKKRRIRGFTESLKEVGYQGIRRGDLVIHAMDAFAGAVGVADSDGKGTPVYSVCKPQLGIDPSYYAHVVREMARSQWLMALAKGIRERSTDFRFDSFAAQRVPLLPLSEQSAIATFLNHTGRCVRRYIRAKKKLIALLKEQKHAIIHRTVTRGLNADAPLKPSGVDWLGPVPRHWEVVALRFRYLQCLGKMLDSKRISGRHSLPYLRNIDVQWDDINTSDLPVMDIPPDEYDRYTVRTGDLLVCEGGEVGRCAIWTGQLELCGFQKALHRLRPRSNDRDVSRFLLYVFCAATERGAFNDGHESTIAHLTGDKLRAQRFAFPPKAEQKAIISHIKEATASLDRSLDATRREINLLHEYQTRLIADVVTGKLDVREAAARLPYEADESVEESETLEAVEGRCEDGDVEVEEPEE